MNSQIEIDTKIINENPARWLSAQETPFITSDGTEIMYPYEPVDGQDPTCFTHEGNKILYKDTNYFKYLQSIAKPLDAIEKMPDSYEEWIQRFKPIKKPDNNRLDEMVDEDSIYPTGYSFGPDSDEFEDSDDEEAAEQLIPDIIKPPELKRDTCMHFDIQPHPFDFANLSEESLIACSTYSMDECVEMQNTFLDELLGFRKINELIDSTSEPQIVSVLQKKPLTINSWNGDGSYSDDIYISEIDEYINPSELQSHNTNCWSHEYGRQTNAPEKDYYLDGQDNYDWVNMLKGTPDFELYKDLLHKCDNNIDRQLNKSSFTDLSQYSDCFESSEVLDEDIEVCEVEVLPQVSEDGPIALPKPLTRLVGDEDERQNWKNILDYFTPLPGCIPNNFAEKTLVEETPTNTTISDADRKHGHRYMPDIEYGYDGKDLPHNDYDDFTYCNYDDFHYNI